MSLTLAIIKPDAVASGSAGKIIAHLEEGGFEVHALRMTRLSLAQAREFYAAHSERPFYDSLVEFMTFQALGDLLAHTYPTESSNSGVERYRSPKLAAIVTIRLPLFSGLAATRAAAQTFAPELIPA